MSKQYQAEGLRVALEMERRGMSLYTRAQQFTDDPKLLEVLRELAREEIKHHAVFLVMLDALGEARLSDEENALAAARAADVFFPGGLMQAALDGALASPEAMLGHAMQAERDSIDFYGRFREHLPEKDRAEIDVIIREEEGHLRTLTLRKEEIHKEERA